MTTKGGEHNIPWHSHPGYIVQNVSRTKRATLNGIAAEPLPPRSTNHIEVRITERSRWAGEITYLHISDKIDALDVLKAWP